MSKDTDLSYQTKTGSGCFTLVGYFLCVPEQLIDVIVPLLCPIIIFIYMKYLTKNPDLSIL